VKASAAEMESMRACPLARVWAGVKPSTGAWGGRKFTTKQKRLNRRQSNRVIVSARSILNLRGGKQSRLR